MQVDRLYQRKSVSKTIAEVWSIRDKYQTDSIMFIDDNFAGIGPSGREWLEEFADRWLREVKLPFLISLRAGEITPEQLSALYRAGLEYVNLAIETVDSKVRSELLNRHISTAGVVELVRWCRTLGIRTRVQSMIGLPIDNSLEEALATLNFVKMLNPTEAWASVFQPYPGTKLAKYCIDKGLCGSWSYDTTFFGNSMLNLLEKDKIGRLQKWWFLLAKHKIPSEWINLMLDIKLTDEQATKMIELRFEHSKKELYAIG